MVGAEQGTVLVADHRPARGVDGVEAVDVGGGVGGERLEGVRGVVAGDEGDGALVPGGVDDLVVLAAHLEADALRVQPHHRVVARAVGVELEEGAGGVLVDEDVGAADEVHRPAALVAYEDAGLELDLAVAEPVVEELVLLVLRRLAAHHQEGVGVGAADLAVVPAHLAVEVGGAGGPVQDDAGLPGAVPLDVGVPGVLDALAHGGEREVEGGGGVAALEGQAAEADVLVAAVVGPEDRVGGGRRVDDAGEPLAVAADGDAVDHARVVGAVGDRQQ